MLFLGAVNAVVPYASIAWGEKFITSGTASIFNSTVPLFTTLLVLALPLFPKERPHLLGFTGLALGFAGVGILVTGVPGDGGGSVLLGSLSYAVGNVYARRRLEGVPALVSAVGQNLCGVLVVLPFALAFGLPEELPGFGTVAALVGLGVGGDRDRLSAVLRAHRPRRGHQDLYRGLPDARDHAVLRGRVP